MPDQRTTMHSVAEKVYSPHAKKRVGSINDDVHLRSFQLETGYTKPGHLLTQGCSQGIFLFLVCLCFDDNDYSSETPFGDKTAVPGLQMGKEYFIKKLLCYSTGFE